jgi:hypothetical protein
MVSNVQLTKEEYEYFTSSFSKEHIERLKKLKRGEPIPIENDCKESKTREDVEELKEQWVADPSFDLEDAAGFESYKDELIKFREEKAAEWDAGILKRNREIAELWGMGDVTNPEYFGANMLDLLGRLDKLEGKQNG